MTERIIPRIIEDEMKTSYLGYAMSVIVGRALPDARDGLKPVHRRILFGMWDTGVTSSKPTRKCARIVGDVMGRYHPHGNLAVYDALVRMAQNWNLRYPLVQGQGNFGSIDADPPAADRYTEARLNKLSEELLQDLDKETVPFVPNFDATLQEPTVLPAKLPNLLINGSAGIAVGMATNIPPHNLREVCTAATSLLQKPEISDEELLAMVPGPDFPTGGIILGRGGIKDAYKTGRGKVTVQARVTTEEHKGKGRIIVNEIPYQVNKAQLVEQIADMIRDKKVVGVSDLRDESDREGMRIVMELKTSANPQTILNQLFAHTRLQETFGVIMLALDGNQPKVMSLREMLSIYLSHRQTIVRNRTKYDLAEAEKKAHVLEGLVIALDNIDPVIALIKQAKSTEEAKQGLKSAYNLTDEQASAVLDMKLQKLTSLEQGKLRAEHKETLQRITELRSILADEQKIRDIIKTELSEMSEKYGDARRTTFQDAAKVEEHQLVQPEDVVVTLTNAGYVKRMPADTYKQQKRGGKGIIATTTKEEDIVSSIFVANTRDTLLVFTNLGKVHWVQVYEVPEASRQARGTAIINLVALAAGESVQAIIPIKTFDPARFLLMVTRDGTVKKTSLEEFSNPRRGGIIALGIENDELRSVLLTDGQREIIIASRNGMAVRFHEKDVRAMGRTAYGVTGIKLKDGDRVVAALLADESKQVLTITEKGYGKRTPVPEYRLIGRGGIGVTNIKVTDKNGHVVSALSVKDDDELMLISKSGQIIRTPASQVSLIGRATQGVRVMRLEETDQVVAATVADV
ncbi:DNA gyrase subunit A [Candidatus Woesearchaeota archaeon]|nr:DNA gyrase subunit A [Candidatus Woesearchaeota archaeon]